MKAMKVTAIAVAVIIGGLLVILTVGIPAGYLVGLMGNRLTTATGEKLQISGGATLHLLPMPVLVMRGVKLADSSEPTNRPQVSIKSARVEASLLSLLWGKPTVTEVRLVKPVVRIPQVRRAKAPPAAPQSASASVEIHAIPNVERVVIKDGSVLFVRPGGQIKDRFDHINLNAELSQPDHRADIKVVAKLGDQRLRVHIDSKGPVESIDRSLPLELTLEAPGLLQGVLTSTLKASASSSHIKISDLHGSIGNDPFDGSASFELTQKPQVKLTLDFKRLSLAVNPAVSKANASKSAGSIQPTSGAVERPWSDERMDFDDLNFFDAHLAINASELDVGRLTLAPIHVEAALSNGALNLAISDTGVYDGIVNGLLTLNASGTVPRQAINMTLRGARALPLLSALADFNDLEGKMRAQIDVQGSGQSERAIMSSLAGTVDVDFHDGAIRNINVAKMVRTLTQTTLTGWQKNQAEKTDLNELSALFKIDTGRASTDNLKLLGPLVRVNGTGTADLAAKTLQFKLDTKLVLSLEGQGGPANPVGFGVPVIVQGYWNAPHIYPDMAGILNNPAAAYDKLRDLGAGLFGSNFNLFDSGKTASGASSSGQNENPHVPAAADQQNRAPAVNKILDDIFGK